MTFRAPRCCLWEQATRIYVTVTHLFFFFFPVFITLSSPGNCRASEGSVTHRAPDNEGYFLSRWPRCDAAFGIRQLSAASFVLEAEAQDPRVSVA